MQVDNVQSCNTDPQPQPQTELTAQQPAIGQQIKADEAGQQPATATVAKTTMKHDDTAMQSEELGDGVFTASKDASATTQTPKVSRISESELEALYASLETAKKELAQARQKERQYAAVVHDLKAMERERDRYRAVSIPFYLTIKTKT